MTNSVEQRYPENISPVLLQHLLRDRTCDAERFWSTLQGLDRQQPNQITIDVLVGVAHGATLTSRTVG